MYRRYLAVYFFIFEIFPLYHGCLYSPLMGFPTSTLAIDLSDALHDSAYVIYFDDLSATAVEFLSRLKNAKSKAGRIIVVSNADESLPGIHFGELWVNLDPYYIVDE